MAAPLIPHWIQPSHPAIQKVLLSNDQDFTTKSISLVNLPPYALFAKFSFPPCTKADKPTYATVQIGRDEHMNLNSDLVYINHSCSPSVIFDTASLSVLAGPNGLRAGEEITFFYPSTEWNMAQGFSCFCGADNCRGYISGAKNMRPEQLEGAWLNVHIRALVEEREIKLAQAESLLYGTPTGDSIAKINEALRQMDNFANDPDAVEGEDVAQLSGGDAVSPQAIAAKPGKATNKIDVAVAEIENGVKDAKITDATEEALKLSLEQARKMVDAAQKALDTYKSLHGRPSIDDLAGTVGKRATRENGVGSRELSGEMGGDTVAEV